MERLPLPGLELVRARGVGTLPQQAARVASEGAVRYAEPNHLWYPAQADPPDDPEFDALWGLHNTGQTPPGVSEPGTPGADIDALAGWELASDTDEIVVAVIDTGVWTDHPDLREAIWLNRGELPEPEGPACDPPGDDPYDCNGDGILNILDYEDDPRIGPGVPTPDEIRVAFQDGIDQDGNGLVDDIVGWDFRGGDNSVFDPLDGDDHGTHVAGTIAATIGNGIGVAGVSRARIMPLKFLGPVNGTTADAIGALHYAIQMGADVTNNSWGGGLENMSLQSKIQEANAQGQLFVAAAGNQGQNNDTATPPHYPASYDNANIISVAATTHTDGLASFSSYGATRVDLGAPGESIVSTVPRFSKAVLRDRTASTAAVGFHTFGLEGMATAVEREALLGAALGWMDVNVGDPMLVVDDDGGRSFQTHYVDTLSALGYSNMTVVPVGNPQNNCPSSTNGPTASTMSGYRAVLWLTGDTWRCTLTSADQSNIVDYVNGGADRNFLLFGQDIGFDLTANGTQTSTFLRDVLRADYVADADFNFRLSPVPGSPYDAVPEFELDRRDPMAAPPGGQRWSSAVSPRAGAVSGLRGAGTTWFDGTSMATPHVTGAVAHLLAKDPEADHLEVKERILGSGDYLAALDGTTVSKRRLNLAGALAGPAAPGDLAATPRPAGEIELSWTASPGPGLAGYRVYRGTNSEFTPGPENQVSGPEPVLETSFTDDDTVDGTTYFYAVRAEDEASAQSLSSAKASATADATPPQVSGRSPGPDAVDVMVTTQVRATFSEPMDPATVTTDTFRLSDPWAEPVDGVVTYDAPTRTATFQPAEPLAFGATYTATVFSGVTDVAGNPLAEPVGWSFTTRETEDTTAPAVLIGSPEPESIVGGSSVEILGTAEDDFEVDVVEVAVHREGEEPVWHQADLDPTGPASVTWSFVLDPLPDSDGETFLVRARASDASENVTEPPAEVAIAVDTVAPTNPRIAPLGGRFQGDRRFPVSWSASDEGGVFAYEVQERRRRFNGTGSDWSTFSADDAVGTTFKGRPGRSHCFRVRAEDHAGNRSDWSPQRCTTVPLNDAELRRLGRWVRVTGRPAHYLSSFVRSRAEGAALRRPGIDGATHAVLVATSCPRCGIVQVRWRGALIRRINLRSAQRRPARFLPLPGVTGNGRLDIRVVSRDRPVLIEGLGIAVAP